MRASDFLLGCWKSLAACTAAITFLGGCYYYPDSSERADDDIVITSGKPDANFGGYKTFAVDPEVLLLDVQSNGSVDNGTVDESFAQSIMDRVTRNMEDRGYEKVDMDSEPDLGISAVAISGYAQGVISGGYWGGYWGGYYGGYWGYPGWGYYYPVDYYYSYQPGTLVLDLVDLKATRGSYPDDVDADAGPGPGGLPVVWTMGAYQAYVDDKTQAATAAIDQAFVQSPYLRSK